MVKGRLGRGKWMDLIGPVFGWLGWVSEMSECFGEAESRVDLRRDQMGGGGTEIDLSFFGG